MRADVCRSVDELELFQHLYAPARIHFTRAFSLGRFPYLTTVLCLVQVAVYVLVAVSVLAAAPEATADEEAEREALAQRVMQKLGSYQLDLSRIGIDSATGLWKNCWYQNRFSWS